MIFEKEGILIQNSRSSLDYIREQTEKLLKKARNLTLPMEISDPIVLGFDGYVDNLLSVVRVRHSSSNYEIMDEISEWADRIA